MRLGVIILGVSEYRKTRSVPKFKSQAVEKGPGRDWEEASRTVGRKLGKCIVWRTREKCFKIETGSCVKCCWEQVKWTLNIGPWNEWHGGHRWLWENLLCGFVRVGLRGQEERGGRQQAHAGLSRSLDMKERNGVLAGMSSVEEAIYDDGVRRGDLRCLPAGVKGKGVGLCQVHKLFPQQRERRPGAA